MPLKRYIKPPEVQDKSSDPSCLGALYGTPFDVWALACMITGMLLGIPCIEVSTRLGWQLCQ